MYKSRKKLALTAETIRKLQNEQLRGAAGGQTIAACSGACSDVICPDTRFVHGCVDPSFNCTADC
jgi:hypothetical protein